jgi:hypothetical protein
MCRRRSDLGAATVETALVLPILLFVMFGIMELGGAMKSYSATAAAVRAGDRAASVAGADPMTDSVVLARVAQELGSDQSQAELVVIWHAVSPSDPLPAGCVPSAPLTANTTSVGVSDSGTDALGACNVYVRPSGTGSAFAMADGTATQPAAYYFGCQGASDPAANHKLDCNWPGQNRRAVQSPRNATGTPKPTDFVGVYIRFLHSYYTTFLGSTLTITDQGISLIEPQGYDTS